MFSAEEYLRDRFASAVLRRRDLHPYQSALVAYLRVHPGAFGLVDLGLGKTASALTLIRDLLDDGTSHRPLIVAPIRVARQTWPNEIRKWRHLAPLTYTIIRGEDDDPEVEAAQAAARRQATRDGVKGPARETLVQKAKTAAKEALARAALLETTDIHIINREKTEWLADRFTRWMSAGPGKPPRRRLENFPYDLIVIDESSSFKDYSTKRFKAMQAMRHKAKRVINLTASPAAESMLGLFAQTYLLDGGERFGKFITHFKAEYFDENKYTHALTIKPGAQDRIAEKIADISIVMRADDYLPDVLKPTIIARPVHLLPRELKAYKEFERDLVMKVSDTVIEAETAGILCGKLCQYASGAIYDAERRVHALHDHKIEELKQLVEEADGEPLLVPYWYKTSLARLQKAFPKAKTMDRLGEMVKPWNRRKVPLLFVHPASAGHGLNMQDGGHLMAFFDLPWSNELFRQMIGRLARQGQKHAVRVYLLQAAGTVDDRVSERLQRKEDAQNDLLAYINRRRNVLT